MTRAAPPVTGSAAAGPSRRERAVVVGAGPNGLAGAIELAGAGYEVEVIEAQDTPGGGARTMERTRPGFRHDVCSAIHPLGIGSPFFRRLGLERHGLRWIHPPLALAHPLDDGHAVRLGGTVADTAAGLGSDAPAYLELLGPLVEDWPRLEDALLGPPLRWPRHPLAALRFGWWGGRAAASLAGRFRGTEARALLAGLAAHSMLPLERPVTAAFGLVLAILAHRVGWPMPEGGAGSITDALVAELRARGGRLTLGRRIRSLDDLPDAAARLLDVGPHALARMGGSAWPDGYRRRLERYRYGPAAFKLDLALDAPLPWRAAACAQAGTVHLGGTFEEIAAAEREVGAGRCPDRPFVLLAQPSRFDRTRVPERGEVVWAYCHVPVGSTIDNTERILGQIERFAPGARDRIVDVAVSTPRDLEAMNPNLVLGDINGGTADLAQTLARPVVSQCPYRTPIPGVYLASASTPPGGGVHGMCGYHAARAAIADR